MLELPDPKMPQHNVIIRMKSSSLNPADIVLQRGEVLHLPSSLFRAVQKEQHRHWYVAFVSPGVPSTILDDDIALLDSLGVVKLQPNLALMNYSVVDSVGFVYCRIFSFEVIG